MANLELLDRLVRTPGVSGREEKIRELAVSELKSLADSLKIDAMGNVIAARKGGGKKRVMLSAHIDEIGFIVNHIDKDGFLKFVPVGGFDPRTLISQRVSVHTAKGALRGIIGTKPVHVLEDEELKRTPKIKDLFIDIGCAKAEAEKLVALGDSVTLERELAEIGKDMLTAKALDNRAGVYAMIEALRKTPKSECDIFAVASCQEEVGLRGAMVSAFGIEPDMAIAIDTTAACDLPFCGEPDYITRLGKGVGITIMDGTAIGNVKLVKFLKETAQKKKISHQMKIAIRGGNDAGAIQRSRAGVPVVTLSIPTRYIHSSVEAISKKDLEACIDLVSAFLSSAHKIEL